MDQQGTEQAVNKLREFALPILFVASIGLMCQSSYDCHEHSGLWLFGNTRTNCGGYLAYAVSVGAISTAVCLGLIFLTKRNPEALQGTVGRAVSFFLMVWWACAAGLLTYGKKENTAYTVVGNGYFCCWMGFLGGSALFFNRPTGVGLRLKSKSLSALFLSSTILWISTAVRIHSTATTISVHTGTTNEKFVLACGIISSFIALVLNFFPVSGKARHGAGFILVIWWAAGVFCATFKPLFALPGNGYFSAWASLIFSTMYFYGEHNGHDSPEIPVPNDPMVSAGGDAKTDAV